MWIKSFLSNLRFSRSKHAARNLSLLKPNRAYCEELLEQLDAERYHRYSPTTGASTPIVTLYANIDQYAKKLKEFAKQVEKKQIIPLDWVPPVATHQTVDRFLTSKDGFYLDTFEAVTAFRNAGLQLCIAMRESDTATFGIYEHNLRMLTKLFINLRVVTIALLEVSLTNDRRKK